MTHQELIAALGKATGRDDYLDQCIHDLMPEPKVIIPPRYTASIDAAMTLYKQVPERIPSNAIAACKEALQQWL